ncbi:MAG: FxsA family protein [Deltaproteobacteria bacterium]|nr:FxsA family protein [Candidatus Anaeroferrophillacea bacterium]
MLLKLFLAFTLIPLAELYVLIETGRLIGTVATILLVIGTGIAGAALARQQGLRTMYQVRSSLDRGVMPAEELVDGLLILVAGAVLLTPGLITDACGLFLLWPPGRRLVKDRLRERMDVWIVTHRHFPPDNRGGY